MTESQPHPEPQTGMSSPEWEAGPSRNLFFWIAISYHSGLFTPGALQPGRQCDVVSSTGVDTECPCFRRPICDVQGQPGTAELNQSKGVVRDNTRQNCTTVEIL